MIQTGTRPVFILGGRYGDLMQMLPCWYEIYQRTGLRPLVISSREYCSLYNGVTYVEGLPYPGHWYKDLDGMKKWARQYSGGDGEVLQFWQEPPMNADTIGFNKARWITLQCHGFNHGVNMALDPNYGTSMARRCGFTQAEWIRLPLVFDNRHEDREAALRRQYLHGQKPAILFNFKGISSPFPNTPEVLNVLRPMQKEFQLVDLSKIYAKRIYDLLGLYDAAAALVTSDTATAHLAVGSRVPAMWFIKDGWNGSVPRGNCVWSCQYPDAGRRAHELWDVIKRVVKEQTTTSNVWHFYPWFVSKNPEVNRCNEQARQTWKKIAWNDIPVPDDCLPRLYTKDGRALPYMKDVFDKGVEKAADNDICIYTNTDIQIRSDVLKHVNIVLKQSDALYCFRRDFPPKTGIVADANYVHGHAYSGSDLYAFRARWWRQQRVNMPDMILGAEAWDCLLRLLIERTNKGRQVFIADVIAHEKDGFSWWEHPQNRYRLYCQRHNLGLAREWMRVRGIDPRRFGIPR